jgi:Histidine kinase-, DNA gyrase B-, and HSP90-like ATPase
MDFGATSTIAAALEVRVRVVVHAETQDGSLELWVANAGEPIPEASMEKLFEPFFSRRARASRQGLGLGLYIAFQIAKAHDGTLTVTSSPNETRFTFTMPSEQHRLRIHLAWLRCLRMLEKETQHFLRCVGPLFVRIGSGRAASGPGVAGTVDISVQRSRVRRQRGSCGYTNARRESGRDTPFSASWSLR